MAEWTGDEMDDDVSVIMLGLEGVGDMGGDISVVMLSLEGFLTPLLLLLLGLFKTSLVTCLAAASRLGVCNGVCERVSTTQNDTFDICFNATSRGAIFG